MKFLRLLKQRWRNAMPRFFRNICWAGALVSGTALAVNTAVIAGGGTTHDWWDNIYPYLLGVPAGAAFVAKFTQQYNGQPIDRQEQQNTALYKDTDANDDHPGPRDIEPYDDI